MYSVIMNLVVRFVVILCCYYHVAYSYVRKGTKNGCKYDDGSRQCCSGFFEINKTCHECVGSFGVNCTNPCPIGWFGKRCMKKCSCSNNLCDAARGCLKVTAQRLLAPPSRLVAKNFPLPDRSITNSNILHDAHSTISYHSNPSEPNENKSDFAHDKPIEISYDKIHGFRYDVTLEPSYNKPSDISNDKNPGFPFETNPDIPLQADTTSSIALDRSVSYVLSSKTSYAAASRPWNNLQDFIRSFETKDWIIFCLVAFVLIIFTVIGAKSCRKSSKRNKEPKENDNEYFDLGVQRQRARGEYECIEENVYTYIKLDDQIHESDAYTDGNNA